jgi:hypothetical protein
MCLLTKEDNDDDDNDDDDDAYHNKRMQRIFLFYPFINAEFVSNPQKLCHDLPKVLGKRRVSIYLSRPSPPTCIGFLLLKTQEVKSGSMHLFLLLLYYYYYYYYYYKRHKSNTQKK